MHGLLFLFLVTGCTEAPSGQLQIFIWAYASVHNHLSFVFVLFKYLLQHAHAGLFKLVEWIANASKIQIHQQSLLLMSL